MKIFDTKQRKKLELKTIDNSVVKIYSCGPTVYNFAHIGNFRSYTDIDDKTINGSIKKDGDKMENLKKFTEKFTRIFFEDLEKMKISQDVFKENPSALDYVSQMQDLIKKIFDNGFAYVKDNSIYFDLKKYCEKHDYGILQNIDMENFRATRIKEDDGKKTVADFVLWKAKKKGEPYFDFEIDGKNLEGRPGWHIECSAMSNCIFGDKFDIHTGGIDLIFPHHENEIAQSNAGLGSKLANFWMHNNYLLVDGAKMSKSLNNFYSVNDILKKGYSKEALRFFLLSVHYRKTINYTEENMEIAEKKVKKINEFKNRIETLSGEEIGFDNILKISKKHFKKFKQFLEDDLNISKAVDEVFLFISKINFKLDEKKISGKKTGKILFETLEKFDSVFSVLKKKSKISDKVMKLVKSREEERENKNFEKADVLRDEIMKLGFEIKDGENGSELREI